MAAAEKCSSVMRRVHVDSPDCSMAIRGALGELDLPSGFVLVCIGSDRITGDCLGPLVGSKLQGAIPNAVYGTLNEPIHATNLADKVARIESVHPDSVVLAVDGCLGKLENVGNINVCIGPIMPGTAVNKALRPVGGFHISAVVNVIGCMELEVLKTTRLGLVVRMAEAISEGIRDLVSGVGARRKAIEREAAPNA